MSFNVLQENQTGVCVCDVCVNQGCYQSVCVCIAMVGVSLLFTGFLQRGAYGTRG